MHIYATMRSDVCKFQTTFGSNHRGSGLDAFGNSWYGRRTHKPICHMPPLGLQSLSSATCYRNRQQSKACGLVSPRVRSAMCSNKSPAVSRRMWGSCVLRVLGAKARRQFIPAQNEAQEAPNLAQHLLLVCGCLMLLGFVIGSFFVQSNPS